MSATDTLDGGGHNEEACENASLEIWHRPLGLAGPLRGGDNKRIYIKGSKRKRWDKMPELRNREVYEIKAEGCCQWTFYEKKNCEGTNFVVSGGETKEDPDFTPKSWSRT